ncbi:hypothetical protein ABT071_21510 [Streptomyces sp. NPDC002506]|uniref:hypothetical protein n=1 Tax=Streptomyces sp. NPDC002506 TaxID=3154536 RepID=UPI003332E782
MSAELTPDQILRVVAALEAAWGGDEDALAALVRGGQREQPLAQLITQYGASRLQSMLLVVTGINRLDGPDLQEALSAFREGLISHVTTIALSMMDGWAHTAGDDVRATGELARQVMRALLSFTTDGDDPREVQALLAHLRANAVAHS